MTTHSPGTHSTARPFEATLRSGCRVLLRPVSPEDGTGLRAMLEELQRDWPGGLPGEARLLFDLEGAAAIPTAWLALAADGPGRPVIGVAAYRRESAAVARMAVAVAISHQRVGLGSLLCHTLALSAAEQGIARFLGDVEPGCVPCERLMARLGSRVRQVGENSVTHEMSLAGPGRTFVRSSPTLPVFRPET